MFAVYLLYKKKQKELWVKFDVCGNVEQVASYDAGSDWVLFKEWAFVNNEED